MMTGCTERNVQHFEKKVAPKMVPCAPNLVIVFANSRYELNCPGGQNTSGVEKATSSKLFRVLAPEFFHALI